MAVSVRIEDEAFSDARIELLGAMAGYSRYEALGRMAHLWRVCTQLNKYALSAKLVDSILGPSGSQYLVEAELGEAFDGLVRIKGTGGRVEWLAEKRESAVAGGKARAAQAGRSGGKFTSATSTPPALAGDAGGKSTSTPPALTSAPAPAPAPAQVQKQHHVEPETDSTSAQSAVPKEPPRTAEIDLVCAHYLRRYPKRIAQTKDPTVRRKILARLRGGHTVEQLCLAIDGNASRQHNVEGGYTNLELIVRDAPHVDLYLESAKPSRPAYSHYVSPLEQEP